MGSKGDNVPEEVLIRMTNVGVAHDNHNYTSAIFPGPLHQGDAGEDRVASTTLRAAERRPITIIYENDFFFS